MTPTPRVVLTTVADMLEIDPAKWCQSVEARLPSGEDCEGTDPGAACRCVASWVHVAAGSVGQPGTVERAVAMTAMSAMEDVLGLESGQNIVAWNDVDGRTVPEVVAAARAAADLSGMDELPPIQAH